MVEQHTFKNLLCKALHFLVLSAGLGTSWEDLGTYCKPASVGALASKPVMSEGIFLFAFHFFFLILHVLSLKDVRTSLGNVNF